MPKLVDKDTIKPGDVFRMQGDSWTMLCVADHNSTADSDRQFVVLADGQGHPPKMWSGLGHSMSPFTKRVQAELLGNIDGTRYD